MKTKFLIVIILLSIVTVSCKEEKLVIRKIPRTNLEISLYESEAKLYDTYNKVVEDNASIFFGKKKRAVICTEIEETYFPNDVDFLAKALEEHDDIVKYTLKNGAFGVSYTTKPNEKGKTYKYYYFYYKKDNRCYKFQTHLANYKMEYFEHVKNSMESLK